MTDITLYALSGQYRELLSMEDSVPWEQLEQMLNDLQGDIKGKATNVGFVVGNLDSLADQIDEAVQGMKARSLAARNRAGNLRAYMLNHMKVAGITKIEGPLLRISIKKNPAKVVIDFEDSIPAEYMRQPEPPPPAPDKAAIKAALQDGKDVPGAHLEQGERVEVKS